MALWGLQQAVAKVNFNYFYYYFFRKYRLSLSPFPKSLMFD